MKLKSISALFLALAMTLTMAACGNKAPTNETTAPKEEATETETTYAVLKESVTYFADGTKAELLAIELNEQGLPARCTLTYPADASIPQVIRELTYHDNGTIAQFKKDAGDNGYIYEYNTSGNNVKATIFQNGIEIRNAHSEYDANGNQVKESWFEKGVEYSRDEYEYDAAGNLVKTTSFEYGVETGYSEHEYDANGNKVKWTRFENGVESDRDEYEYDANGNQVKRTWFENSVETYRYEHEYDANGNKVKETQFSNGIKGRFTVYEYDIAGNMLKETNSTSCTEYQYDTNSNLVKTTRFENGVETYRYEYEYDANGNKIKETRFANGDLTSYTIYTWYPDTVFISTENMNVFSRFHLNDEILSSR